LGIAQNMTHPFSFRWKKGDFRDKYASLSRSRIINPPTCFCITTITRSGSRTPFFPSRRM